MIGARDLGLVDAAPGVATDAAALLQVLTLEVGRREGVAGPLLEERGARRGIEAELACREPKV